MVNERFRVHTVVIGVATGLAAWLAGCTVDLAAGTVRIGTKVEPAEGTVAIRFRNLTINEAVDVEFHATNEPLQNLPGDLFVPEHLVTTSIGVAGTGIIQPFHEDIIEFPCTANLAIGTRGGSFVDNETGEPRGVGTMRWAQEGPLTLCGMVVTFEFSADGDDFATILRIGE